MVSEPRTFTMAVMPHVDAVLVFDATDAETTGYYTMYSITPDENERFLRGEWDATRASLEPTGHIPVTEVVRDEEKHEIRILTYGIERFAVPA